jgi:hypothetical protein
MVYMTISPSKSTKYFLQLVASFVDYVAIGGKFQLYGTKPSTSDMEHLSVNNAL